MCFNMIRAKAYAVTCWAILKAQCGEDRLWNVGCGVVDCGMVEMESDGGVFWGSESWLLRLCAVEAAAGKQQSCPISSTFSFKKYICSQTYMHPDEQHQHTYSPMSWQLWWQQKQ